MEETNYRKNFAPEAIELVEEKINNLNNAIDKDKYLDAKNQLNKWFGDENNQICKPEVNAFLRGFIRNYGMRSSKRYGTSDIVNALSSNALSIYLKCNVYIRFPHIHLTNSNEESHDIEDLWVIFSVDNNFAVSNLRGTRSTLSYEEALVGYFHSHLRSKNLSDTLNPPIPDTFCLGQGEINQSIAILQRDGYDPINFTLFCLHLKNYVEWESIEGVPHTYMKRVKDGPEIRVTLSLSNINSVKVKLVGDFLIEKITELDVEVLQAFLNPIISGNSATIKIEENLSRYLAAIYRTEGQNMTGFDADDIICNRRNGKYITLRTVIDSLRDNYMSDPVQPENPIFFFKDQPVFLKIKPKINEQAAQVPEADSNEYIHPQILKYIEQHFNNIFPKICYSFERIIKENTFDYIFQTARPNLLSM